MSANENGIHKRILFSRFKYLQNNVMLLDDSAWHSQEHKFRHRNESRNH